MAGRLITRKVANALNRAVQDGELAVDLPWPVVTGVKRRFGVLTGVIDVLHGGGRQSFGCFGADRVAAEMSQAWAGARA